MHDTCIYDRFEQCFHNCPTCPQCESPEPDYDLLREIERERDT